jgi:hypothetical protein
VRPHAKARSSKSSKKSKRSEVSPLKDGALFDVGAGIALIPFETTDMTGFDDMVTVDDDGGETAGLSMSD